MVPLRVRLERRPAQLKLVIHKLRIKVFLVVVVWMVVFYVG